jgi:O-methyltransferase
MLDEKIAGNKTDLEKRLDSLEKLIEKLENKNRYLEHRLLSKNRHRWDVIEKVTDYFMGAQLDGDYAEFGVYKGETFAHAAKFNSPIFEDMKFWAFDSFQGLPDPRHDVDITTGYSGGFYRGQFACSQDEFVANLEDQQVDLKRVKIVPGWYAHTLKPNNPALQELKKIAFAWIDCDLYESTVPVLEFITDKLSTGAVVLFDDWRCFHNRDGYGQRRACREWLDRNPHIKLNEFIDNDYNGYSFTVEVR